MAMLDFILKPIDWAKKTHNWLLNGDPRQSPIKKRWVSSDRERVQILLIRGISALYSLIYAILFQAYSIGAEFVVGVFVDLWNSDRKHARDIVLTIVSIISFVVRSVIVVVVQAGRFLSSVFKD